MGHQAASFSASRLCLGTLPRALVACLALASTIGAFADTPVEIPDAALRACVEEALDKDEGTQITQDDMESLTTLAGCNGVSNLDGLEFAANLTQLSLWKGGITDLAPVSGLVRLRTLDVQSHPVNDLVPLAGLESLQKLRLWHAEIADLSPILSLPRLWSLDVARNPIRDLPHWPPSSGLRDLAIGYTSVRDLSPLTSLPLLSHLSISGSDFSDLDFTALPRLKSLYTLGFRSAINVDLSALPELPNLQALVLREADMVSDLSSLANYTSLRSLDLGRIGLRSLDVIPLPVLGSLQRLELFNNQITEIDLLLSSGGELRNVGLGGNSWLSRKAVEVDIPALRARGVEVRYDPPLAGGPNAVIVDDAALRRALVPFFRRFGSAGYVYEEAVPADRLARVHGLGLSNKGIVSLQGMEHATSLRYLWLSGNGISDISPLADLPLIVLALDGNPIGDFRPLAEMTELQYLALDNTSLREIPPLPRNQERYLSFASFADNSIADLGPLGEAIGHSSQLWLGGNSISSLLPMERVSVNFLHLNDNQVADLAGLRLERLEELHIRNNALRDISPLLEAPLLWMLDAERNPLDEEALTVAETLRERGAAVLTGEPVPFLPAAAATREGLVRVINRSGEGGEVFIEAWDDAGVRFGPVRLRMDGQSAVHFDSTDLQSGNPGLGLAGIGPPTSGDWRLALTSPLDIEVLAYVRTADGFLTPMHDVAADATLPTLNPGSNDTRRSVLRLVNRDAELTKVVVGGYDDGGSWEYMPRAVDVLPGQAWTASATALEDEHGVGDGRGKWRLQVPGWPWFAMSLLDSASGHLTNLSTVPDNVEELADGRHRHRVPLLPADGGRRDGFVRVVNLSYHDGEVLIDAVDDAGGSRGPLQMRLDARQTVHFNARDLAQGNADKGLEGTVGAGQGDWRLTLTSALDLLVPSYARTPDGYLAAMHDVVPLAADGIHRMPFFNPGSNAEQLSKLRLLNHGGAAVSAIVTGIDDAGQASTAATLRVPAGAALTVTAAELEAGGEGVSGRLGNGDGRWRLRLAADGPLTVMNLLESPEGRLANMSTVTRLD